MRRALSSAALAGVMLGLLDVSLGYALHRTRFGAPGDRALFFIASVGIASVSVVALTVAVLGVAFALNSLPARARVYAAGVVGATVGVLAGAALFSGTGVRRLGLRPSGIALSIAACAALAAWAWTRRDRLRASARWWPLLSAGLGLYAVNATVLTRQYELLHGLLALACAGLVTLAFALRFPLVRRSTWLASLALGVVASALIARSNALRSTMRQAAPVARYPAMLIGYAVRDRSRVMASGGDRFIAGPHLPLHGLDLVLITIDALRADRLSALGGHGRMPTLDAIAARGVLFRRAYCTTPHTSYSLASLMMGTYARSVLTLPAGARGHGTLASWLGAAGYATAGFFPPAVFAVDGERFGALRDRRFDFATRVEGYADASVRVREVERWLDTRRSGERVFAWVHFFEPHEPYSAHAEHPYGDRREARYDAECSAADDAIRGLREAFARRRRRAAWFITADHGEEFGEHGGSFHGTSVYDEQVRVPLVIEVPGVAPGVVDEPVSLVDLAPTIVGGVGIPRPPRLRGNNLGALVRHVATGTRAFAATGSLRMVATARDKLIADLSDGTLELYDLARDPGETVNLADRDRARARTLRGEIESWEASHARVEAQPVHAGESAMPDEVLPDVLNRAIQGDVLVAHDVAALLGAGGFVVRRRSARVLGDLGVRDAVVTDALARELASPDVALAREAGVSLALLADARGGAAAQQALSSIRGDPGSEEALRVAVALARLRDHAAVPVLSVWVNRARSSDAQRDQAVAALRSLDDAAALPAWVTLLDDIRLAPRAAEALGALGDVRAIEPLEASLATQRYPLSIRAILRALIDLHAPDAVLRVRDALAVADPLPEVWPMITSIMEPGVHIVGAARALRIAGPRPVGYALRGGERSDRARGIRRLYLRTRASEPARLTVLPGTTVEVPSGEREVTVDLAQPFTSMTLRLVSTAPIELLGVVAR